ncbi:MAG: CNNM domain-containing protein [Planctomycetia bacterium]|nr:CNNM domain-containing protein [Planctomycetia bacterium]
MLLNGMAFFSVGMLFSFLFSGSEIGFYRLSRTRLILHSLEGGRRSRFLLWLVNHPSLFLSTILVGNNVANYFVSMGLVLLFQSLWSQYSAEFLSAILGTPFVFVYGELLPKSVFLQVPNRFMKFCAPILAFFMILFLPVSLVLWGINQILSRLLGQTPQRYSLQLTPKELKTFFGEGKMLGIIHPSQQTMMDTVLAMEKRPVRAWSIPLSQIPIVSEDARREEILPSLEKASLDWILVRESRSQRNSMPEGFYTREEILLTDTAEPLPQHPILILDEKTSAVDAFARMLHAKVPFALLQNRRGELSGVVRMKTLRKVFLSPLPRS